MIIPPSQLNNRVEGLKFPIEVRTASGALAAQVHNKWALYRMIKRGEVEAVGTLTKVRYIRMLEEPSRWFEIMKANRKRLENDHWAMMSDAGRTVIRATLEDSPPVWQHHKTRCEAWPHGGGCQSQS
jgi:hypothetical protein